MHGTHAAGQTRRRWLVIALLALTLADISWGTEGCGGGKVTSQVEVTR